MFQHSNALGLLKQEELDYYLVKLELNRRDFMENGKEVLAKVVQLRTQLVSQGHTRHLLAETDLMTLEDPLLFSRHWRKRAALSH